MGLHIDVVALGGIAVSPYMLIEIWPLSFEDAQTMHFIWIY